MLRTGCLQPGFGRTALLLVLGLLAGCASEEAEKRRFIEATLEDRASRMDAATRAEVAAALVAAERAHEIDALLLLSMMEEESTFNPRARSSRGAMGLLQVRPMTGQAIAEASGSGWQGPEDLYDPEINVRLGAAYLAELRTRYPEWERALAAYNMGPTRVMHLEARGRKVPTGYSARVLRRYEQWTAAFGEGR